MHTPYVYQHCLEKNINLLDMRWKHIQGLKLKHLSHLTQKPGEPGTSSQFIVLKKLGNNQLVDDIGIPEPNLTPGCSGSSWQGLAWSNPWCLVVVMVSHPKVVVSHPKIFDSLETNIFAPKKWGNSRLYNLRWDQKAYFSDFQRASFFSGKYPNCQVKHSFFSGGNEIYSLTSV